KTVTLTAAQSGLPSHYHSMSGHVWMWGVGGLPSSVYITTGVATAGNPPSNNLVTSQNNWNATQNAGGTDAAQAHTNVQPYMAEKYIIKGIGGVGALSSTVESVLLDRVAVLEA